MSHSSELAARLEARAVDMEKSAKDWQAGSVYQQALPNHQVAKAFESFAERDTQHAADLRAAAQAVRAMEWRPIAEAPKDGTEILTWVGGVAEPFKYICRWSDSYSIHGLGGNWTDGLCNMGIEVTQWMPLPAPPEVGG